MIETLLPLRQLPLLERSGALIRPSRYLHLGSSLVPLQRRWLEQPRNCSPAFAPLLAVLIMIGASHRRQLGAPDGGMGGGRGAGGT